MMKNALILHGTKFDKDSIQIKNNWFPWLKKELEARGYEVLLPELPKAWEPNIDRYWKFLKDKFKFNENSLLIGHSSGASAILGLLNKLPKGIKVSKCILVSGFVKDRGWNCEGLFTEKFDWKKIKENSNKFIIIHSETDPYVPIEDAKLIAKKLGVELINVRDGGHFNLESNKKYKKFPLLMKYI